ncbi:hypothetical protein K2173_006262 [Erythroxylum novogranatense]|uniref:Transmembrane protein 220 n=1 Tax=Erythroxylum novogranatense TaxID=1862640 RepID=A0AAV8TCR3_9ROSI|nr:hypothetical protein K2173_006262 [Erythroxylum novogranatense]
MATSPSTKLFTLCSILMAALFAYSASVQLNDPDWYFWFPLYSCGGVVNLMNCKVSCTQIRRAALVTLWLGIFLFLKVVFEGFMISRSGFWSLDLSKRLVREKTGSGLVVASMVLHLLSLHETTHAMPRKNKELRSYSYISYGMAILACFSFGLPFFFFVIMHGELKFDHNE